MCAKTNVRRREGDLLKIALGNNQHAYAQVAAEPLIVFFDGVFTDDPSPDQIASLSVLFRLLVANHAVKRGRWPVVGRAMLASEDQEEPFFYKQDAITGRLTLYHSSFAHTNWERAATLAECIGLENAAVWEPKHVEDRLRDHYAGKRNKWLDSLQIDLTAILSA
jgi:hypothetical protein